MRRRFEMVIPCVLSWIALSGSALFADSATIVADRDNSLFADTLQALSNGQGAHLFSGNTRDFVRRALVRFDIAGNVPAAATINSVTLTLHMSRTRSTAGQAVDLHRVSADWGEFASSASGPEGRGAPAQAGDATWTHRFFDTTAWTNPGGDFVALSSAQQTVGGIGFYVWGSNAEMVADVQAWLDSPTSNFGWILIGNEIGLRTAKRFDSRENVVVANRPQLVVDFTDPVAVGGPSWGAVKSMFR